MGKIICYDHQKGELIYADSQDPEIEIFTAKFLEEKSIEQLHAMIKSLQQELSTRFVYDQDKKSPS